MYTVFTQGTHMTVKNLNLALPMDLYVALKRDAELVASPVATHIRGVLMRYIRSTDEAVHQRKAELAASTKPVGTQQQAIDTYAELAANPILFRAAEDAKAWMGERARLLKASGFATEKFRLPNWMDVYSSALTFSDHPAYTNFSWEQCIRKAQDTLGIASTPQAEETPESIEAGLMAALKGD
jgi:hypothetical protein